MRRTLLSLALIFVATPLLAQSSAQIEANKGVLKLSPTAQLPNPCRQGQLWFDTTTNTPKSCNDGLTWTALGGGGGITINTTTITGGTDTRVLFDDAGVIGESAGLTYVKGTSVLGTSGTTAYIGKDGTNASPTYRGTTANSGLYFSGTVPTMANAGVDTFFFGGSRNQSALDLAGAADNTQSLGVSGTQWKDLWMRGWVIGANGEAALNADYTNATTTFSPTALSVTLTSGRTYSLDLALLLTESTAADGVKIDFNGGAATITNFAVSCVLTNDTGAIVAQANAISVALATVINATATVTTAQHLYRCSGTIVPSSTNTFIVRAGQNAHSAGTLTIKRGSWLSVRDARPL